MSENIISAGAILSAGTTAIVYLWRHVQASAQRCEEKLDRCHEDHGKAQDAIQVLSVRVGRLEGQLESINGDQSAG